MANGWRRDRLPEIVRSMASRPRHEALRGLVTELLREGLEDRLPSISGPPVSNYMPPEARDAARQAEKKEQSIEGSRNVSGLRGPMTYSGQASTSLSGEREEPGLAAYRAVS